MCVRVYSSVSLYVRKCSHVSVSGRVCSRVSVCAKFVPFHRHDFVKFFHIGRASAIHGEIPRDWS